MSKNHEELNVILSLVDPETAAKIREVVKAKNVKEFAPRYNVSVKGCISVKGLNPFVTNFMPYVAEAILANPELILSCLRDALPEALKAREAWEAMTDSERAAIDAESKRRYNAA